MTQEKNISNCVQWMNCLRVGCFTTSAKLVCFWRSRMLSAKISICQIHPTVKRCCCWYSHRRHYGGGAGANTSLILELTLMSHVVQVREKKKMKNSILGCQLWPAARFPCDANGFHWKIGHVIVLIFHPRNWQLWCYRDENTTTITEIT